MKIKRVKKTFRTGSHGAPRGLNEGDLVPDTHPLVRMAPQWFEDVEDYVSRTHKPVEEATAAPGEKRSLPVEKPRQGRPPGSKSKANKQPEKKADPKPVTVKEGL